MLILTSCLHGFPHQGLRRGSNGSNLKQKRLTKGIIEMRPDNFALLPFSFYFSDAIMAKTEA